jgi:hypothetical protein
VEVVAGTVLVLGREAIARNVAKLRGFEAE